MVKTLGINETWLMGYDIEMPRAASNYSQTSPSIIQKKRNYLPNIKHQIKRIIYSVYYIKNGLQSLSNDYLIPVAAHADNKDDLNLLTQVLNEL